MEHRYTQHQVVSVDRDMPAMGENTYESIPTLPIIHKRKKKNSSVKKNCLKKGAMDSDLNKTAAAMLEDITRKSCHFLSSTATTCTAIRLQKIVTSSRCSENSSFESNFSVSSACHSKYPFQDHQKSKRKDITECDGPGKPDVTIEKTCEDVHGTSGTCLNALDSRSISAHLDDPTHVGISTDRISAAETVSAVFAERVIGSGDVNDSILPMGFLTEDPVLQNKLVAEKIRNKERMRKREKAKEERQSRMSSETLSTRNGYDSNDDRNFRTASGSPSDMSTLSADDDERIVSSGTAESISQQVRNNDSLEKNMLDLTNSVDAGFAPFPYSIGPEFDRVPPLQPHPPYANSIYGPGSLHGPIFNQPGLQIPYGSLTRPFQAFTGTPNNASSPLPSETSNAVERTIPKLNNLVLSGTPDTGTTNNNINNINSNIILPSGRGKPRETERVINKDVENLKTVYEKNLVPD